MRDEGKKGRGRNQRIASERAREKKKRQPKFLSSPEKKKKKKQIQLTSVAETTSLPPRNLLADRVMPFACCCEVKPAGEGLFFCFFCKLSVEKG